MELVLLTVPGCPNAAAFEARLACVLARYPAAVIRHQVIASEREAAEAGLHGSPTLLVDGTDPFAAPGQPASLSCRLYWEAGPVPSAGELRRVRTAAGDDRTCWPGRPAST